MAKWWNGIHAGFRNQCLNRIESSNLSLATMCASGETVNAAGLNPVASACEFESHLAHQNKED